jgi:hypothetical protein
MTTAAHQPIKVFQFPRMFGIPNLSPAQVKICQARDEQPL